MSNWTRAKQPRQPEQISSLTGHHVKGEEETATMLMEKLWREKKSDKARDKSKCQTLQELNKINDCETDEKLDF